MVFFNALGGVFGLLLIVCLGFYLGRIGWFSADSRKLLPKLVTKVTLPPFLACIALRQIERGQILDLLLGAAAPALCMIISFILAFIVARLAGVNKRHFGLFCTCVANSNTIFIGIPVNQALFGHEAVPYVLLYYFASTVFFWTVCNYAISRDGLVITEEDGKPREGTERQLGLKLRLSNFFSPPMLGFVFGVFLASLNVPVPDFLILAAEYLGQATTPLALIFIGLSLEEVKWRELKIGRDLSLVLIGRIVLSPALMFLIVYFLDLPELMRNVFIMQSSLPVLMQAAILSAYYNTDPEFGSLSVTISTVICTLTIPIYMCLL